LSSASPRRNDFFVARRLAAARASTTHPVPAIVARTLALLAVATVLSAALCLPPSVRTDQPSYDTVGAIEGEAISVQGPLNIEVVQGRTRTILRSGSDIRVNSGQAQIDLIEGGHIAVCGPAHLSVLKSVNLLTLALDTGTIHAHIEGPQPALTIYTAQIQAKPFAIGDAPQDTLVGFDQTGAMCIRADRGAVRVEQQLTAQSIVVPQSGEVLITNGELESLRSGVTHCSCELQLAKTVAPTSPQTEVSRLPTAEEMQKANMEAARANAETAKTPKAAERDAPVYQVFMPPLTYDASAKVQRENFDPQLIVLVRRVRVRPTLIFQGRVEGASVVAQNSAIPPAVPAAPAVQTPSANPKKDDSLISRVRAFFHRLFS
jgi:hypothetical protein